MCACLLIVLVLLLQGQIKQLLTGLMLNTPPLVRAQLSEALTLISSHDFPAAWPQLLPELVERLAGGFGCVVGGVACSASSWWGGGLSVRKADRL